jgi:hypothetical protein
MEPISKCRICKSTDIIKAISLGDQIITSRFPIFGDYSIPKIPIDLYICNNKNCGLLQLYQTTFSSELYEHEYGYKSGISNTMCAHLKQYNSEILSKISLNQNDTVLDIGSNDSTLLSYYSTDLKRIGCDPTGLQFKEYYTIRNIELIPTYFTAETFNEIYPNIKCKIITSISMFYDLPDPVQFAFDIYNILDDDGIWTCEQSYLLSMLKSNSFDTICHEHLEYYAFKQIKFIADLTNFKIIDVKFNDCNGGSFRIYLTKKKSRKYEEATDLINNILKDEEEYGLSEDNKINIFKNFMNNCDIEINKLVNFINEINNKNETIYIYGASTKGNCLLQYANIGIDKIKFAVERNPIKLGKMTCTGIPIIMEETMRENPPNYLLVLPWHLKEEIIKRENDFLQKGGKIIFPLPEFKIITL